MSRAKPKKSRKVTKRKSSENMKGANFEPEPIVRGSEPVVLVATLKPCTSERMSSQLDFVNWALLIRLVIRERKIGNKFLIHLNSAELITTVRGAQPIRGNHSYANMGTRIVTRE